MDAPPVMLAVTVADVPRSQQTKTQEQQQRKRLSSKFLSLSYRNEPLAAHSDKNGESSRGRWVPEGKLRSSYTACEPPLRCRHEDRWRPQLLLRQSHAAWSRVLATDIDDISPLSPHPLGARHRALYAPRQMRPAIGERVWSQVENSHEQGGRGETTREGVQFQGRSGRLKLIGSRDADVAAPSKHVADCHTNCGKGMTSTRCSAASILRGISMARPRVDQLAVTGGLS